MADFPATKTVHTPSGPEFACEKHAAKMAGLFRFMGHHVAITIAPEGSSCSNCRNEYRQSDKGEVI